jgi:hypothetical protein
MKELTAPNGTAFTPTATERWLLTGKGKTPSRKNLKVAFYDLKSLGYPLATFALSA